MNLNFDSSIKKLANNSKLIINILSLKTLYKKMF